MTLSASRIGAWLSCARKYAFRYVEEAPREFRPASLAFGRAVHSALEWLHTEKLDGRQPEPDKVVRIFAADWDAEQDEPLRFKDGDTAEILRHTGEGLVREYVERMADASVEATELPFDVELVDPETGEVLEERLRGYFDLLLSGDVLVEIKTAARRLGAFDLRHRIQLSAYAYAYRRTVGRDPSITVVSLLKTKEPRIEINRTERTKEDDAFFVHLASEVSKGIASGASPPNPGWQCADCEYQRSCGAWRGSSPKTEVVPDALEETRIQLGGHPWTADLLR